MTPQEREDLNRIARVLRAGRKIAGLTQTAVAQHLQISQGALSKMESGSLIPSSSQWFHFCQLVGIDALDSFITGVIDNGRVRPEQGSYPQSTFKLPRKYARDSRSKVRYGRPLVAYYESKLGTDRLKDYLSFSKLDPDYFLVLDQDINLGFTLDIASELLRMGILKKKDLPTLSRGLNGAIFQGKLHRKYLDGEPGIGALQTFVEHSEHYGQDFVFEMESRTKTQATLAITPSESTREFEYRSEQLGDFLCRYHQQLLERIATYQDGTPPQLTELECHFKTPGARRCVYQVQSPVAS